MMINSSFGMSVILQYQVRSAIAVASIEYQTTLSHCISSVLTIKKHELKKQKFDVNVWRLGI